MSKLYINLENVLKENNVSKNQLCQNCNLQRTQLNNYCKNKVSRIDLSILSRIFEYFRLHPKRHFKIWQIILSLYFTKKCDSRIKFPIAAFLFIKYTTLTSTYSFYLAIINCNFSTFSVRFCYMELQSLINDIIFFQIECHNECQFQKNI